MEGIRTGPPGPYPFLVFIRVRSRPPARRGCAAAAALLAACSLMWDVASAQAPPAGDADASAYLAELLEAADARQLHASRYWQVLLHYDRGPFGWHSRIDDPSFFLAPDGKTQPRAELHATLAALFRPATTNDLEHPVCRFVARFEWLRQELNLDVRRLPVPECTTFARVYRQLRPASATLVFPAAYMNSPASLFGHTLITFDAADQNRLLSKAVNYAAVTGETFGPFFAFSGIFGLYKGYYSIEPYHDKVEEYTDISYRDMWEYELDLTQEEVDRMVRHTWELQNVFSYYYFFNENCSFNLLYLIEAARPSLRLTDRFFFWVIPMDTVKLVRGEGLIRSVAYRPSKSTTIHHLARQLGPRDQELALSLARGVTDPQETLAGVAEITNRVLVLDLAADYTQYLYSERVLPKEEYTRRFLQLLKARSRLGQPAADTYAAPPPEPPEEGHGPGRITLGGGVRADGTFLTLGLRPAYHQLTDPPAGYDPGAQIQFLPAEFRYDTSLDRWQIERWDVVDILSISPRDRFFQPASWKVRGGAQQAPGGAEDDRLVAGINTGRGVAHRGPAQSLLYLLGEFEAMAGGVLDHGYAAGLGASLGAVVRQSERWHAQVQARGLYFGVGEEQVNLRVEGTQTFRLQRETALSLRAAHVRSDEDQYSEAALLLSLYF